jgi:DNA-binding transcriptional regulator YiaG
MRDEEYLFYEDSRDKKNVARSARYKRTHNGKGGRMKLPSDYMTNKEIKAMSGEVKTYRLNDPMKWEEFKEMPDDIRVTYIKLLREKYNVPDRYLAKMLGISQSLLKKENARLGISIGKTRSGRTLWDKAGFLAWCGDVPVEAEAVREEVEETIDTAEEIVETVPEEVPVRQKIAIPGSGNMVFEGKTEDILKTIGVLLGGANVHISITWDVLSEGD